MKRRYAMFVIAGLFLALATGAHASIGCVAFTDEAGAESVNLYESPGDASRIIREIPLGDIVQYIDPSLGPIKAEGWVWVRHDITQDTIWQSGEFGWMKVDNTVDCG